MSNEGLDDSTLQRTVCVNRQPIIACLYSGDLNGTVRFDVTPVLKRFCVNFISLEVVTANAEYCKRSFRALGEIDLRLESTATRSGNIVGYV
jgi:hypothetical protein